MHKDEDVTVKHTVQETDITDTSPGELDLRKLGLRV